MRQAPIWVGAGAVAVWLLWSRQRPAALTSPSSSPPQSDDLEVEALARMLASETGKREAWPWMAVAARNAAAARRTTIAALLRSKNGQDAGWGSNKEGHWASTARGATAETLVWARRWFAGQIPEPPGSAGVRSFFEVDEHGVKHDPTSFRKRNPELGLAATVAGWEFYRRE